MSSSSCCSEFANSGGVLGACGHLAGMLDRDLRTTMRKPQCQFCCQDEDHRYHQQLQQYHHHQQFSTNHHVVQYGNSGKHQGSGLSTGGARRTTCGDSLLDTITHNLFPRRIGGSVMFTRGSSSSNSSPLKHHHYLWESLQRLKRILIVTVYILTVLSVPGSLSAPANRHMAFPTSELSTDRQYPPRWVNPCNFTTSAGMEEYPNMMDAAQIPNAHLAERVVDQARIVLNKASQFKDEFAQKTFNQGADQLHQTWKGNHYEWLPSVQEIPKELGDNLTAAQLSKFTLETFDETLLDSYEYLQRIAVGLEQILWDQQENNGAFVPFFNETQNHLRLLLCEIQMAMYEREITMRPDVTRELMAREFRQMDSTSRNLRDWIIFRDYMNALEYVVEVFNDLQRKLQQAAS